MRRVTESVNEVLGRGEGEGIAVVGETVETQEQEGFQNL